MKSTNRGRPIENDTPILIYTQEFNVYNGEKQIWNWDKTKFKNGPISVEFFDPVFTVSEKLLKELEKINTKYLPKKGERKTRITKEDKQRIEIIEKELDEFHYSFWPEDRPKIRKNKFSNK